MFILKAFVNNTYFFKSSLIIDQFFVLQINKTEKVKIRCRIHHWATNPIDRLPFVQDHWLQPAENLFSEDTIKTLS